MAATTFSVRPNRPDAGLPFDRPPFRRFGSTFPCRTCVSPPRRSFTRTLLLPVQASSPPSEMSLENALELLGVADGASLEEILRAKNSILATCGDDKAADQTFRTMKQTSFLGCEGVIHQGAHL